MAAAVEGSERAARKWDEGERAQVDAAIEGVARATAEFTADDVWAALPEGFPVTKGLTPRLLAAKNRGLMRSTGETVIADRGGRHDHSQRLSVWGSLVYRTDTASVAFSAAGLA